MRFSLTPTVTPTATALIAALVLTAAPVSAQERSLEIARERCSEDQWVLRIEPNHSSVGFSIPIMAGITRVTGKFTEIDCVICYTEDDFAASSVKLVVQAASVKTGIEDRDGDLGSEAFFDVARTPEIVFESERIEQRGDGWVAIGQLSMKGRSRPVALPFAVTGLETSETGRPIVGVAVQFAFNRHDFGVGSDWVHSAIPGFLGDEVTAEVFMYTRSGRKLAEMEAQ